MANQSNARLLLQLFGTFLQISPMTFGGGYAMIPLMEREVVQHREWITQEELTDIVAVSGSIPGAVAVNCATLTGYRVAGLKGALAALIGALLPTFFIVVGLCIVFLKIQDHPKAAAAFQGIRAATVALIAHAAVRIGRTIRWDKMSGAILFTALLLMILAPIHPVLILLIGAGAGILFMAWKKRHGLETAPSIAKRDIPYRYADYYIGDGI